MQEVKFTIGRYRYPVGLEYEGDRVFFHFPYSKEVIDEIKKLEGRKYHGFDAQNPRKIWSAPLTPRNKWCLEFYCATDGIGPYKKWTAPSPPLTGSTWNLYKHQAEDAGDWVAKRVLLWAHEMGSGKTLGAFAGIEHFCRTEKIETIWWVGNRSSLNSTIVELRKWKPSFESKMLLRTYDAVRTKAKEGIPILPDILVLDEFSKCKNPVAERSKAVKLVCDAMRERGNPIILGATGTPAPKSPADWWNLSEILRPGWLSESSAGDLQRRLALIEHKINLQGSVFPRIVTWLDDSKKCGARWDVDTGNFDDEGKPVTEHKVCGKYPDDHLLEQHEYQPSVDEVGRLYRRLKGLVSVRFKKDCLDLPKRRPDEIVKLPMTSELARLAKFVTKTTARAATALTLLRELSDGFIYEDVDSDETKLCPQCNGTKKFKGSKEEFGFLKDVEEFTCDLCNEQGRIYLKQRVGKRMESCAKDDQLKEDLEAFEELGRLVVYAAFNESVTKISEIGMEAGWFVVRVDGRGWKMFNPKGEALSVTPADMLDIFQNKKSAFEKVLFVGHPGSAGMGITLNAADTIIWYSLPFNGEDFIQANDRLDRPGISIKGALSKFYYALPTDEYVHENLKNKVNLQNKTLGEVSQALEQEWVDERTTTTLAT